MMPERSLQPDAEFLQAIGDIAARLSAARHVLLCGHENPDGDVIGSMLALKAALEAMGKTVVAALPGAFPDKYRFLADSESIVDQVDSGAFDVAVALDCDGVQRMTNLQPAFEAAPLHISIDHHASRNVFGDLTYLNPRSCAAGAQVYHLLRYMQAPITHSIATCLYTAISTDTGNFKFQNTNAEALGIAGELAAAGASPYEIAQATGDVKPLRSLKFLGRALASLQAHADGRIALGILTLEDEALSGAQPADSDGIIDSFKATQGAEVYILLRQSAKLEWRGSLRSKDVDVAAVARSFGGGGHKAAAGFTAQGTQAEVEAAVLEAAKAALGR